MVEILCRGPTHFVETDELRSVSILSRRGIIKNSFGAQINDVLTCFDLQKYDS